MEKDDEFEIIPHKEIVELKKEIELLKKNPLGKGKNAEHLLDAINDLNGSISNLITVFQEATNVLKEDKHSNADNSLNKRVSELFEQNKEIAEAIISLADMIKSEKKDNFIEKNTFQPNFLNQSNSNEKPKPQFTPPRNEFTPNNQFNFQPREIPPPGNPNPMPNLNQKNPFDNLNSNQRIPPLPGMDLPPPPPKKDLNKDFPF
jgi:hypothetical protein